MGKRRNREFVAPSNFRPTHTTRPIASPSPYVAPTALAPRAQHVVAVADAALMPVVARQLERQQLLLLHGAARVVPELAVLSMVSRETYSPDLILTA